MDDLSIRVSTKFVDTTDGDDYWRAATRPFYVTERTNRDVPLQGAMTGSTVGTSLIGETTFNSQDYFRNRRLIAESELEDQYIVQAWISGEMIGNADGTDFSVQPSDVSFLDLGKPLRASALTDPGRAGRTITLLAPRALVEAASPGRSLHGTVLRGASAMVLTQCLQSVSRALPHLDKTAAAQYEDVIAALLKASSSTDPGALQPEFSPRTDPDLRARALTHIIEHLGESWLSPVTICATLSVSRAQLYRAFQHDGGIAQVIRRKRLEHAYRELTAPEPENLSIEDVSRRWGFTSKTQFVRAFDSFYGVTPSRARAEGRRTIGDPSIDRLHRHLTTLGP